MNPYKQEELGALLEEFGTTAIITIKETEGGRVVTDTTEDYKRLIETAAQYSKSADNLYRIAVALFNLANQLSTQLTEVSAVQGRLTEIGEVTQDRIAALNKFNEQFAPLLFPGDVGPDEEVVVMPAEELAEPTPEPTPEPVAEEGPFEFVSDAENV